MLAEIHAPGTKTNVGRQMWEQATTAEVRAKAGMAADPPWRRYLYITNEIAREMLAEHPELWWREVPLPQKNNIFSTINDQLKKENIASQEVWLMHWRMPKAIESLKHVKQVKTLQVAERTANMSKDDHRGRAGVSEQIIVQGQSTRPYDPVRDI
ncbi:hypothetical protein GQ44DRAFT_775897 [Phaeosphaeriaceae sp. PMI808]|nr:hypothetical protein GQ44DRAFT_775897 [Phaeosphaeriaceae sp. PMI808]